MCFILWDSLVQRSPSNPSKCATCSSTMVLTATKNIHGKQAKKALGLSWSLFISGVHSSSHSFTPAHIYSLLFNSIHFCSHSFTSICNLLQRWCCFVAAKKREGGGDSWAVKSQMKSQHVWHVYHTQLQCTRRVWSKNQNSSSLSITPGFVLPIARPPKPILKFEITERRYASPGHFPNSQRTERIISLRPNQKWKSNGRQEPHSTDKR